MPRASCPHSRVACMPMLFPESELANSCSPSPSWPIPFPDPWSRTCQCRYPSASYPIPVSRGQFHSLVARCLARFLVSRLPMSSASIPVPPAPASQFLFPKCELANSLPWSHDGWLHGRVLVGVVLRGWILARCPRSSVAIYSHAARWLCWFRFLVRPPIREI